MKLHNIRFGYQSFMITKGHAVKKALQVLAITVIVLADLWLSYTGATKYIQADTLVAQAAAERDAGIAQSRKDVDDVLGFLNGKKVFTSETYDGNPKYVQAAHVEWKEYTRDLKHEGRGGI